MDEPTPDLPPRPPAPSLDDEGAALWLRDLTLANPSAAGVLMEGTYRYAAAQTGCTVEEARLSLVHADRESRPGRIAAWVDHYVNEAREGRAPS